jgi:hypothetical protein
VCSLLTRASDTTLRLPVTNRPNFFEAPFPANFQIVDDFPSGERPTVAYRERRMRRRWSISSLFNTPRLIEQATVDGFVRHSHALISGIVGLQPSGNLFGPPVQDQFTRNDLPQPRVQGRLPGLVIRLLSAIGRATTLAGDLSAHRGGRSIEVSGDLTNRRTGSDPS